MPFASFIRYSSILAGNTADPKSLPNMVDALASKSGVPATPDKKTLVVMDAGIATEDNLTLIKEKGYDYLCVSRSRLSGYELSQDMKSVTVQDSRRREITLTRVRHDEGGDHYLQIKSPTKALKEESMNRTSSRDSRRNSPRQGNLSGRKAGRRHTKGS